jgi:hypothetical protein
MKNLLERAKPELLAGIEKYAEKYSNSGEYVRRALSEAYFVNKLTIETWVDIRSIWFQETGELSNHPWDLFDNQD